MRILNNLLLAFGFWAVAISASCGNNPAPVCPNGVHAHFIKPDGASGYFSCINRHGRPFTR